jgi:hypothetical protein
MCNEQSDSVSGSNYLRILVTNRNGAQDKIMSGISSENVCYSLILNGYYSSIFKRLKIRVLLCRGKRHGTVL